jgi:hypothetical protein
MSYMNQTFRKFGDYPFNEEGILTAEASYQNGYDTGLTWKESYTPGGPMVYGPGMKKDKYWIAYCAALIENHNKWHDGFQDGRAAAVKKLAL